MKIMIHKRQPRL